VCRYLEEYSLGRLSGYAGTLGRPQLSRSNGLAKGACLRAGRVPLHRLVPRAGEVRTGSPDASGCHFHPVNIAEGFGKRSRSEKARFLNIAEGSLDECRYYLILAQDLGYGQTQSLMAALEEVSRLLNAYSRAILASGS